MIETSSATRLLSARTKAGWSIHYVANESNISAKALTAYEKGKRSPRDEVKIRLAKVYRIPVADLFF